MNNIKDSLITVSQGAGGVALSFWEVLPDILRMLILVATLAHITVSQGVGGVALSFWEVLPDILRMGILLATLIHITIKIIKDYNK